MNITKSLCAILVLSVSVSAPRAAAMPSFMERAYADQKKACRAGFDKSYVKAGSFTLMTYQRFKAPSEKIRIYIEGDGRAWETRHRLSDDPTPSNPVALGLATADPSDAVVYIARPGQFPAPGSAECDPAYWSARRFAPEVVEAFDKAIDTVKERSGARYIELVGYSGGAAIGILVAARRADVASIRTIAGNLEPEAVNRYHNVSALTGSLDPAGCAAAIANIPQRHFAGACDKVMPLSVTESFAARIGDKTGESVTVVEGATHSSGWTKTWPSLLEMPLYKGHSAKSS